MLNGNGFVRHRGVCGICGKVNFASKRNARSAVRRLVQSGANRTNGKGDPLRVYSACDADSFHVGHGGSLSRPNLNDPALRWV